MGDNLADKENEEFRSLCAAIGFVVLNWALVEQQVDIIVNVAFKSCGGKDLRKNGDIPVAMKQKIDFLKRCFRRLAPLFPFSDEAIAILLRVGPLATQRDDLVHSAMTSVEPINGGYTFRKVGYRKDDHFLNHEFTFHPSAFDKLSESLGDLLTDLIVFSTKLAERFPA